MDTMTEMQFIAYEMPDVQPWLIKAHRGKRVKSKCKVEGCDRVVHANGLCNKHDLRMRQYGRLDLVRAENGSRGEGHCDECEAPIYAKGKCVKHYFRSRRHDPNKPVGTRSKFKDCAMELPIYTKKIRMSDRV